MDLQTLGRPWLGRFAGLLLVAALPLGGCAYSRASDHPRTAQSEPSPAATPAEKTAVLPLEMPAVAQASEVARPVPGSVLHINEDTFERQVLHSDVPVLVDFYASWCGPCKKLAPTLEELAAESSSARVVKVDIDDNPALAARYGVTSVPILMVFKDGEVTARQTGLASKSHLKAMLAR